MLLPFSVSRKIGDLRTRVNMDGVALGIEIGVKLLGQVE